MRDRQQIETGSTIALRATGPSSDDVRQLLRYTWVSLNEKGATVKPGTASPGLMWEAEGCAKLCKRVS